MTKPTAAVLYFPGTNSHLKTMVAFERAGAKAELLFLTDVLNGTKTLDSCDVLCIPGGFSFGDHLGAGALAGAYLREELQGQLSAASEKPLIAICNGFQIAMRSGVFGPDVTLDINESGTFHHAMYQRHIVDQTTNCVWLDGLSNDELRFPCAHGEGRFRFTSRDGWQPALRYPDDDNPDGSTDNIAGVTTPNNLVLGLMNHPERLLSDQRNQQIFRNGVRAAQG